MYKIYTIKKAITVVVASTRNLVVLVKEIGKATKLKNKKLSISEEYNIQIAFFLKTSDQFSGESHSIPQQEKHLEADLSKHRTWLKTQLQKNDLQILHTYTWYLCQTGKG